MNAINKKSLMTGIVTGIVSWIIMFAIAYLKFGNELFNDQDNRFILLFFTPVWAVAFGYCGYAISRKWKNEKAAYAQAEDYSVAWESRKRVLFSSACLTIAKIALLLFPVYVIAYLDKSEYLQSSPTMIAALAMIGVVCFLLSRYLKKGKGNANETT